MLLQNDNVQTILLSGNIAKSVINKIEFNKSKTFCINFYV